MNPHQQQQHQQHVPMTTRMMPATTLSVTPTGHVGVQSGSVIPTATEYVTMPVSVVRDPGVVETYQSKQSKGLGITLVITGVLGFSFGIVGSTVGDQVPISGHCFIGGVVFVAAGLLGIAAANKRRCMIATFMSLTIVSVFFTIPMLALAIRGASGSCVSYRNENSPCSGLTIALEALFVPLTFVAAIASLWGLTISGRIFCRRPNIYRAMFAGNQQMVIVNQQPLQPAGAAQYYGPHVVSTYCPPPQQQQLYPQQPFAYGNASAPNADEVPSAGVGSPNVLPPSYSEITKE